LYESFYGLHANPFKLEPDPCFLYHSSSHDRVAQDVMTALRRRAAAILVTGESGIGKTMLCGTIVDQLDRRTLTSFVTDSRVSAESLLRTVLVDFGVISRGRAQKADHHELTDALRSFLASLATLQASAVLIVDDAHTLAMPALEQVRLLSELGAADRPLQVLLVGDPDLATTLRRAELKALDRRIALRCRLEPLARVEVAGYVMHRVAVAGTRARINFDDGALARVFELSDGVPRVVNMICDRALTLGQHTAASVIQRELIDQAATDIEVRRARGERHGLVRALAAALMFLLLMILGAAASAWIFSDVIRQTIAEWRSIPPAPESPVRRLPAPLAPLPMPEGMPER
jgi:general secretion pathway protein A